MRKQIAHFRFSGTLDMTPLISNNNKATNNRKEENTKAEPSASTSTHQRSDDAAERCGQISLTSGILSRKSSSRARSVSNGSSGKRSRLQKQLSRAKKSLSHKSFSFYPMHKKRFYFLFYFCFALSQSHLQPFYSDLLWLYAFSQEFFWRNYFFKIFL